MHPSATPTSSGDPATSGPSPLPQGTDTAKAREQEEAALDNAAQGYDDPAGKAGGLSPHPDGDTQGGPGANNDAAQTPRHGSTRQPLP